MGRNVAAALLAGLALAGSHPLPAADVPTGAAAAAPPPAEYVALGSSFASGPGIAEPAADGPAGCWQSSANYPRLLARQLGLTLLDHTCGGATTAHVLHGGQHGLGPQVDGITEATSLVTVTIGGNDIGYISNLAAWSCANKPEILPPELRDLACKAGRPDGAVTVALAELGGRLDEISAEIRRRAPRARIVFVDYTTVLPEKGSCFERLPISDADLQRGRAMAARLAEVTAESARRSGASMVRASEVTRGHDVCAAEPWVSGWVFPPTLTTWAPGAYHPTGEAMRAIAEAIARALAEKAGA